MNFLQSVRSVLSNYVTFSGRARRSEYWWFYLFTIVVSLVTAGIDAGLTAVVDNQVGIVGTMASALLFLPSLAVTARRLHDTGRSGWWMVLPLGPFLITFVLGLLVIFSALFSATTDGDGGGPTVVLLVLLGGSGLLTLAACLVLLVFLCTDSDQGWNKYGPSPKEAVPPPPSGGYYPAMGYGPPR
jgi:uncharacterized membrane protein YhaH (DUF805 family)